ncbi:predicted protein [Botrytis cinerea T4]|uniref:Uncharacterized protein n=1 Tax=Botryotinia fuckeliana (strain T4) TaxID=999810 RepID=G2YPP8_BOTF4|nr:predicted protein [Botrytis cinerea T4]
MKDEIPDHNQNPVALVAESQLNPGVIHSGFFAAVRLSATT